MENSKIEWTDHTWSPWWGCTPVSPGCANCYAASLGHRYGRAEYRKGAPRSLAKNWSEPEKWNRQAKAKNIRLRVFPSMCDIFDEEVPDDWKMAFFDTVISTPNLDWLLLTKRPKAALEFYEKHIFTLTNGTVVPEEKRNQFIEEFIPNVWLGVSVENQRMADERIPLLLSIPARKRFLSVEPMLEKIDMSAMGKVIGCVDWVIFGGESGPGARACYIDGIRDGIRQCNQAGVPCFVKQIGRNPTWSDKDIAERWYARFSDPKGGNLEEWPHDIRVRQQPV